MIAVYEERVDINFGRLFFVLIKNIVVACFHFFRLFLWQIFFSIITLICNKCFQTAKFFFQSCIKYFMYLFFFLKNYSQISKRHRKKLRPSGKIIF